MKTKRILCLLTAVLSLTAASCGLLPEEINGNKYLTYVPGDVDSYSVVSESTADSSSLSSADSSSNIDTVSSTADSSVSSSEKSEDKNSDDENLDNNSSEEENTNPFITADIGSPGYATVPNSASVKYLGRTVLSNDVLWCSMSGTGAEFEFTGKNLEITIAGDSSVSDVYNHRARIGIFVNGERAVDEMISSSRQSFKVIKSDNEATYNVKIIKLSESEMSSFGIVSIDCDEGEQIVPSSQSGRKIEFIGDSITCGYGIDDGNPNSSFSTATEDITRTFAHLTAEHFGADYNVFAMSGYGILSGYTSNPSQINTQPLIPSYYSTLGCSDSSFSGSRPQDIQWDFSSFQPDAVVINLGTNDSTYCQNDSEKLDAFVKAYVDFLKQVRSCNPNAQIFCILGTCSDQIYSQVEQAVNEYSSQTGDSNVHSYLIDSGDSSYGYAASYHPSAASNALMADVLSSVMSDVMGW